MQRLELTRAEVAAVIDYVFQHVRATNGTGRKVYQKMREFLMYEGPEQGEFKFRQKRQINVK